MSPSTLVAGVALVPGSAVAAVPELGAVDAAGSSMAGDEDGKASGGALSPRSTWS